MEERRESGSKNRKIEDAISLYECSCCIENLYAIFTDFVSEVEC